MSSESYIGFIRYKGKPVKDGYLDARKSAQALIGFDEALRFFVGKQDSSLSKIDYEIPVRIRKGSWEAIIPHDIASWMLTAAGLALTTYFTTAAKKMAENDFENASITSMFKRAIEAMQWIVKIGIHLGTLTKRSFENLKFRDGNKLIGIPNKNGKYLYVPKLYLDFYETLPPNILKKIASVVSDNITLEVGVSSEDKKDKVVSLGICNKKIFCPDNDDVLFSELQHDDKINLTGFVTRGNENANSIGFQYKDHILTCYPKTGNIVRFKSALFLACKIVGTVTREDKFGDITELRPKIKFTSLKPLPKQQTESQPGLFDDDI